MLVEDCFKKYLNADMANIFGNFKQPRRRREK